MGSIEGDTDTWPGGYPYVIQATVQEDGTVGTHICTLTVTPGAGNEMQLLYGSITAGAGAANIVSIQILDASAGNEIATLVAALSLASGAKFSFPFTGTQATGSQLNVVSPILVSGTMALKMTLSTATVSLAHTFAVVLRVRADAPTATLADTVGAPTLTFNTNKFF